MPLAAERRARTRVYAGVVAGFLLALAAPLSPIAPAAASPVFVAAAPCPVKPGGSPGIAWAQQRLDLAATASISTGAGVKVAVIDSGFDQQHPQLAHVRVQSETSVVPGSPGVVDCVGHGTEVTAIIAGQSGSSGFVGVAPGVTIMPIKQTNTEQEQAGGANRIAAGIDAAVRAHAKVINISVVTNSPGANLRAAVARAARAGVVIVAAAGNDTTQANGAQTVYPASYSTSFPNVIAVSATTSTDQIAQFSLTGHYVTLAAPGAGIEVPAPLGGFVLQNGTSFATPFVTGTVALLLATHHGMSPAEVRDRLEATADPPPAAVPDPKYGYGIVNPYLALTSLRQDGAPAAKAAVAKPLPAPMPVRAPDHDLQHVALAVGLGLLAVAVLAAVAAAVVRSDRRVVAAPGRTSP